MWRCEPVTASLPLHRIGGTTTYLVIANPIPGQEERNSDHLLEAGVAIRCNNMPTLAYKIDRLLADPLRLATMKVNAYAMSRPNSARDIVQKLLELS